MPSSDRLEIRSIIKFCQKLGDTPTATYEKIQVTKGKDSVSRALVFSWHKRFKDGEESIEDREREGRKRKITATLVASIEQALQEDRRLTVRTLSDMFDISIGTIYTIALILFKLCQYVADRVRFMLHVNCLMYIKRFKCYGYSLKTF